MQGAQLAADHTRDRSFGWRARSRRGGWRGCPREGRGERVPQPLQLSFPPYGQLDDRRGRNGADCEHTKGDSARRSMRRSSPWLLDRRRGGCGRHVSAPALPVVTRCPRSLALCLAGCTDVIHRAALARGSPHRARRSQSKRKRARMGYDKEACDAECAAVARAPEPAMTKAKRHRPWPGGSTLIDIVPLPVSLALTRNGAARRRSGRKPKRGRNPRGASKGYRYRRPDSRPARAPKKPERRRGRECPGCTAHRAEPVTGRHSPQQPALPRVA